MAAAILSIGDRAIGCLFDRLRLDAAEHCSATAFPAICVRHLANDVLIATLAVRHQRCEIALVPEGKNNAAGFASSPPSGPAGG